MASFGRLPNTHWFIWNCVAFSNKTMLLSHTINQKDYLMYQTLYYVYIRIYWIYFTHLLQILSSQFIVCLLTSLFNRMYIMSFCFIFFLIKAHNNTTNYLLFYLHRMYNNRDIFVYLFICMHNVIYLIENILDDIWREA